MDTEGLPNNVNELKEINGQLLTKIEEFQKEREAHQKETEEYKNRNILLEEKIIALNHRLYGRKSEKWRKQDYKQAFLFNEEESYANDTGTPDKKTEYIIIKEYKRKKGGRKKLAEDLPRVEIIIDIDEDDKICACGCERTVCGKETSEKLDIIPQRVYVKKYIRLKYSCKICGGAGDESKPAVITAPVPVQLIPKSIATSGLLAYIITSKFVDHLPFYRQENIFDRIGADIGRASMCHWSLKVFLRCNRLLKLMALECGRGHLLSIDETRLQVLKEPGRDSTSLSFMWVFRGGTIENPIILFRYRRTRSGKFIYPLLKNFEGVVQSDGFSAYDALETLDGITHAGCWAHVRRKFFDLIKVSAHAKKAKIALGFIQKLYKIEKKTKVDELSPREIVKLRQKESKPIVEKFKDFLDKKSASVNHQGAMGKAVDYALNQWPRLLVFLDDGLVPIDNNLVENAIRPFVVGRKGWLFNDRPWGARASSGHYSLIETAKANGLEPYWYLRYLYEHLPYAVTDEDLRALMPMCLNMKIISEYFQTEARLPVI